MKTSNLSRLSVNAMSVEIDGIRHIIHGEDEIKAIDEKSIRRAVAEAESAEELRESLSFYGRTLNAAAK